MYDETNTPRADQSVGEAGTSAPFSSEEAPSSGWERVHNSAPPGSAPGTMPASTGPMPAALPTAEPPVPALAGLLGLIPGVGAMYNGQFAKGLAHLVIFAILVSLADHVDGVFGIFVAGWICYQAFEAYHTARARRDGLPLPNAFGLNDIGERLGFGKNWPGSFPSQNEAYSGGRAWAPPPGTGQPVPGPGQTTASGFTSSPMSPPSSSGATYPPPAGANWVGYVPPAAFGGGAAPYSSQAAPVAETGSPAAGWSAVPYADPVAPATSFPMVPASAGRRFPVGAVLLILLGALFLLSNLAPGWRFGERWLLPLLLTVLAIWIFSHRVSALSPRDPLAPPAAPRRNQLICALRMPVLLLVLAVMFALQTAGWLTLAQTWPLLLISFGALLLLERTLGRVSLEDSTRVPTSSSPTSAPTEATSREAV